jgi:hypothetical protein
MTLKVKPKFIDSNMATEVWGYPSDADPVENKEISLT